MWATLSAAKIFLGGKVDSLGGMIGGLPRRQLGDDEFLQDFFRRENGALGAAIATRAVSISTFYSIYISFFRVSLGDSGSQGRCLVMVRAEWICPGGDHGDTFRSFLFTFYFIYSSFFRVSLGDGGFQGRR